MTISIDEIRTYKKGTRLRADEFNALVENAKQKSVTPNTFQSSDVNVQANRPQYVHKKTLFFTSEAIPPYSIFAVLQDESPNGLQVEKFDENRKHLYRSGCFGTNNKNSVLENTSFWGYILDDQHDFPVKISGNTHSSTECGFLDGEFTADCGANGLYLSGQVSNIEDLYFVRKNTEPSDFWVQASEDIPENGSGTCELLNSMEWNGTTTMDVYAPATGAIESETKGIAKWFPAERRWYFIPMGGTAANGHVVSVSGPALNIVNWTESIPTFATEMNVFSDEIQTMSTTAVEQSVQKVGD